MKPGGGTGRSPAPLGREGDLDWEVRAGAAVRLGKCYSRAVE